MHKLVPTLLLFTSACLADGVVNLQFTALPSTSYDGTYNGFTTTTVGTTPGIPLICDDEAHNTIVPSGVLVYDYSTINALTYARFDPSTTPGTASYGETQTSMYEEAAVIIYNLTQLYSTASAETIAQYQYALWNLMNSAEGTFNSSDPNKTTDNTAVGTIQTTALREVLLENTSTGVALTGAAKTAQQNLDTTLYSELVVYTPTSADASNQEWLRLVPTPEPATAGVAGLILFGMGFAAWKRRKVQATA